MPDVRSTLRRARPEDADLLLEWRNDPAIWSLGSTNRPVDPAEHRAWFSNALASPDDVILYIIEVDGEPSGQLRLNRIDPAAAEISVYMARGREGAGHGTRAILEASRRAFSDWSLERVVACVREDNPRGRSAFEKIGFALELAPTHCGPGHVELSLRPR